MATKWALIKVDGKYTVESVDFHTLELNAENINTLAGVGFTCLDDKDYPFIATTLALKHKEVSVQDESSRRIVCSQPQHCISLVQLLLNRKPNVMHVYMRSSDTRKLQSDLTFLCRLALTYQVEKLEVSIGSLHVYMEV